MKTVTTSVGFQDALGNLVLSGKLILTLSQSAEVTSGGGLIAPKVAVLPLDAVTAKIASTQIWFNDELTPSGTTYHSELLDSGGNIIADFGQWSITGASADLSTMVPVTSATISLPGVVLTAPALTQTVVQPTGTNLNVNRFENIRFADQFASTSAAFTDASTTGAVALPPNYTPTAFTNSNNRPVLDFTKVDWRGVVNVKDFGAKGDNVADDTAAIQAAINFVCTGNSTTAPTGGTCTTVAGFPLAGTVFFPAGTYRTSAPILTYTGIALKGAGKLASRIAKINNTSGTLGTLQAGSGVGRTATSCGGGPCNDNFNVDAIIAVVPPYTPGSPNITTGYAGYWELRDIELFGAGANGTAYGVFAPRSMRFIIDNVFIEMNCTNGNPASCGSVQGNGFYTADSHTYTIHQTIVDSSTFAFHHVNDGSNLGSGTSAVYNNNYAVNSGYAGMIFYGLSYSTLLDNANDNVNVAAVDVVNINQTYAAYSFQACNGISVVGGGAEGVTGKVLYAEAGSTTITGGFKTVSLKGYTSAGGRPAVVDITSAASVYMAGTVFTPMSTPGNFFNLILDSGSVLIDEISTLPSGANTFISYGGGSTRMDTGIGGMSLINSSGTTNISPSAASSFLFPLNKTGQTNIVSTSGAINTVDTVIIKTPALIANRVLAGTSFRIILEGTCTSTAANTSTFTVRWGTNGTTADGTVAALTTSVAAVSGTNNGFRVVIDLVVRTAGAAATSQAFMQVTSDGNIGIVATPNAKSLAGTAFNTTTASAILSVSYVSAAATTTSTFTNASIEILNN